MYTKVSDLFLFSFFFLIDFFGIFVYFPSQDASLITVVTGTNRLDEGGDTYDALKLISHPLYVSFTITNDIGLIKLKEPIKFNDKIKPIKLPTVNTTEDKELVLSGWGTTGVRDSI